jgi:hypothetical protein
MNIKISPEQLFEYMFEFHLDDDLGVAEKFYVAHTPREALRAFKHTCRKNHLHAHGLRISRWNRWRGEWEKLKDFSMPRKHEVN